MHVQIVDFQLQNITEEQYRRLCDELSPAFSELPGLRIESVPEETPTPTWLPE
jgi:hypothetical protein